MCAIYRWHVLMVCYIQVTCFDGVLYIGNLFWWCAIYRWLVLMVCYIQLTCSDVCCTQLTCFDVCYIQVTCSDGMQHNWRVSHLRRQSAAKNTKKPTTVTDLEGSHSVVPNPSDHHNSGHLYSTLYSILNAHPSRSIVQLPSLSPYMSRKWIFSRFPHQTPCKLKVYRSNLRFSHGAHGDVIWNVTPCQLANSYEVSQELVLPSSWKRSSWATSP